MIGRVTTLATVVVTAAVMLGACAESNQAKDPWVSGERLQKERARSDAQQDELRDRLVRSQTDR